MGRYVESAVLKIVDQSTPTVKKVKGEMRSLLTVANRLNRGLNVRVNVTGLDKVHRKLASIEARSRRLNIGFRVDGIDNVHRRLSNLKRQIDTIARTHRIRFDTSGMRVPNTGASRGPGGGQGGGNREPFGLNPFGFREGKYPGNIPRVFARRTGYLTSAGVHASGWSAIDGIRDADTQRNLNYVLGLSDKRRASINAQAEMGSRKYQMVSKAGLVEIGRGALANLTDPRDAGKVMDSVARSAQGLALTFGSGKAGEDGARKLARSADVAGFATSGDKFDKFLRASTKAAMVAEKDINLTMVDTTFRRLGGQKFGLNETAIGDIVSMVDEMRGLTGKTLQQFNRNLTSKNFPDKNKAAMQRWGLRDGAGEVIDRAGLVANPFDWVNEHIRKKLVGKGIDVENVAAVEKAVTDMGFLQGAARFVSSAILKRDELELTRDKRNRVRLNKLQQQQYRSIVSSFTALNQQWKNLADTTVGKFAPVITKGVGSLANLFNLGSNNYLPSSLQLASGVAGTGAGYVASIAVNNPLEAAHIAALGVNTAALNRNTASSALGVLGGKGGKAGPLSKLARNLLKSTGFGLGVVGAVEVGGFINDQLSERDKQTPHERARRYREQNERARANQAAILGTVNATRWKLQKLDDRLLRGINHDQAGPDGSRIPPAFNGMAPMSRYEQIARAIVPTVATAWAAHQANKGRAPALPHSADAWQAAYSGPPGIGADRSGPVASVSIIDQATAVIENAKSTAGTVASEIGEAASGVGSSVADAFNTGADTIYNAIVSALAEGVDVDINGAVPAPAGNVPKSQ